MVQRWLSPNLRVMLIGMVILVCLLAGGALLVAGWPADYVALRVGGAVLAGAAVVALGVLIYTARLPRLAYEDGHLLVYLRSTEPARVPIECVECFFLGKVTRNLPAGGGATAETKTVVVRLAESAVDWHQREVKPALGQWCGGYITIRGTWCEPLSVQRVNQLNCRLAEVQRQHEKRKQLT